MDMPLRTIRPNIVQSIRAFRVSDLQDAAQDVYKRQVQLRSVRGTLLDEVRLEVRGAGVRQGASAAPAS